MNLDEYTKMYELEDRYWWFVGRRQLALGLLRKYSAVERPRVLDLGCGTGVVLRELASWAQPIGLDMSEKALSYCRCRELTGLAMGDGECLPFIDACFDGVLGLDIFEHIRHDDRAFAEVRRVLRPGGILVLSVPAYRSLWGPHDIALHHHRRYRAAEIRARLREAGLEPVRIGYSVFFLFPIVVVWRMFEKRKRGPAKASLVRVPGWGNRLLILVQALEAGLISRFDLPWGSSVIAVARRPR